VIGMTLPEIPFEAKKKVPCPEKAELIAR